jgi:chemotaxis protein MotB
VAGHTDDVPIHTSRFPSNWELSTARAVEVTKFLIQSGMRPDVLGAAGYGEFDPVTANDSTDHRGQNRRIEIVLLPNIAELPQIDDLKIADTSTPR